MLLAVVCDSAAYAYTYNCWVPTSILDLAFYA